jgi:hypothetical protein
MPQLPEDIIDRLRTMERRIQQLSTAVNTRPALTRIGGSAISIYDIANNEIIASDDTTGGLARPWLTLLPPRDTNNARWPQTNSAAWATIARSLNMIWQPQIHLIVSTAAGASTAGEVKVLINGVQWGDIVTSGTQFDHTGPVSADFDSVFGTVAEIEIQAHVTSGTGSVYAQPQLMYGTQS